MSDAPSSGLAARIALLGSRIDAVAHWYYVAIAVPLILFVALLKSPLGAPDEWSHVARSAQIADGVLTGTVVDGIPQGTIDRSLKTLADGLHHQHRWVPVPEWRATYAPLTWTGEPVPHRFTHAVYFPLLYIPQTLTILVARWMGVGFLTTLTAGSLLTGLVCVALGAIAIKLTPVGKLPLAFLLAVPMNLFLFASFSADGPLMALAALLGASVTRLWSLEDPFRARGLLVVAILAALLVAPAKLVYAPAAAAALGILVFHPGATWRLRSLMVTAGIAVIGAALAWHGLSGAGHADYGPGDAHRQMAFALQHPGAVLSAFLTSLREHGTNYLEHMIGVLGWLDARLDPWLYPVLWSLLGAVVVAEGFRPRPGPAALPGWLGLGLLGAVIVSVGGIFFSLYLIWTPPETADLIDGVQGRYFLPLLPLLLPLFLALPGISPGAPVSVARAVLLAVPAALFPFFMQGAIFGTIVRRYYS